MPFLTATPWLMPAITGGMGIWQALSGQRMQQEALAEAKKPRFTEEMAKYARESGTSNLTARLAERGMLDSSMLPGGIAELEKRISEARAGAGTMGDVPGMLGEWGYGMGRGGAQTLGSMYEAYMLRRLLGGQGTPQWATSPGYNPQFPEVVPWGRDTGRPWYPPYDQDAWQWGS